MPGTSVLVKEFEGGELRVVPIDQLRGRIRSVGGRMVNKHSEALEILAEPDPDPR